MMVINHGMEFGYELISAIPYAYWLHTQNRLTGTTSNEDTECLYYFSDNHHETTKERRWELVKRSYRDIPNCRIHQPQLDWSRWAPPPYKEHYRNNVFDFDLVVCNKYNVEIGGIPRNYLPPFILQEIFEKNYDMKILYFHMTKDFGRDDKVESLDLQEWDVVNSFDNVWTIQHLASTFKHQYTLNKLQCLIFANCDNFITVQGGGSIFASYFAKRNVIYAVSGHELEVGSFLWYNRFNGSEIIHVKTYGDLLDEV